MPETLLKLSPHRDLQCYFERPSAIAAMSNATASGFTVSGTWRQQFDWAVIEWNRDNVFEHPVFRALPDGDLSGLRLTYDEQRTNSIALDSDLFPTVDWPHLRVWASSNGTEQLYKVALKQYATPLEGTYQCATAEFELQGTITAGAFIGLAWLSEHHTYQVYAVDTVETAVQALVDSVNAFSPVMRAQRIGAKIRLFFAGQGQEIVNSTSGSNGNRIGIYSRVTGSATLSWDKQWATMAGGTSPTKWRIDLNFSQLRDLNGVLVPTGAVRKMRWTYAADLQSGAYQRSEFQVLVSNWSVTGTNREYFVAGPGSRRIEDDGEVTYLGAWNAGSGNFSGGTIHYSTAPGSGVTCTYQHPQAHRLFIGTRSTFNGASISIAINGSIAVQTSLNIPNEDVLTRLPVGFLPAGTHTVTVTHAGAAGSYLYFDFVELAVPSTTLPVIVARSKVTLATDWDTDHSIALPPERTAWMLDSLGFNGRANHYMGALWFYELIRTGHQYASGTVTFGGIPTPNGITELNIGGTVISHLNLVGDTAETIARAFELEINRGYTGIRAQVSGPVLQVIARNMGVAGNNVSLSASPATGTFSATASGQSLAGGVDGEWHTDVSATPRLNRAVRDWSRSYFTALRNSGIDAVTAFSMELQHGDTSTAAGLVQRYPSGNPVVLNTPAVQTNFSPVSTTFWKEVYLNAATIMQEAGLTPYLQFGEVQWWYFPYDGSGMPFYDTYTRDRFRTLYGREMATITSNTADPAAYPEECAFLPELIGEFTATVMSHVRAAAPNCRFEVLYPPDVNETAFNRAVNFPAGFWTPAALDNLKTESFTYTYMRNLELSRQSMMFGAAFGFPPTKRSHLVGISDPTTAWRKEAGLALAQGNESIVLFALDQFCLIGYAPGIDRLARRSVMRR